MVSNSGLSVVGFCLEGFQWRADRAGQEKKGQERTDGRSISIYDHDTFACCVLLVGVFLGSLLSSNEGVFEGVSVDLLVLMAST